MLNFYTSHECPHYKYVNMKMSMSEGRGGKKGDSRGRDKGGGGEEKQGRREGGWEAQSLMSFFWDAAAWVIE